MTRTLEEICNEIDLWKDSAIHLYNSRYGYISQDERWRCEISYDGDNNEIKIKRTAGSALEAANLAYDAFYKLALHGSSSLVSRMIEHKSHETSPLNSDVPF